MSKVSVIVVIYNNAKWVPLVFDGIKKQTHKELEIFCVINSSQDGSKELVQKYPDVKILDYGQNTGFAGGNNLAIKESGGEFIQLVNPDLIMEPDYIEKMLKAFEDSKVAAATGKLLRYDINKNEKSNIIDSTGIILSVSGRAKDRGQLEKDNGQYDKLTDVFGVCGAGPMYRRSALELVKYCEDNHCEYFDEDFLAYWEDVDLSWRFHNVGFKQIFVPEAVAYHGRTAGQSKGGYLHAFHYIKQHNKLASAIKRLNFKNQLLMYLKNSKFIHPFFIVRELVMLGYITVLETSTLKVIPQTIRLIPKMLRKRKAVKKISAAVN
jgi:GT2 family glycosyltransferase